MKLKAIAALAVFAAFAALSGCETMSADQCAAADWGALGYQDANANGSDRYSERAQSCAQKGITADASAYRTGFDGGMHAFCQPQRGFQFARAGGTFNGACPGELAGDFNDAYADGRRVHEVQAALDEARNRVSSAESRRNEADNDIRRHERALAAATTDDVRNRLTSEIDQLRRERRNANEDMRVAQEQVPDLMRNVDRVRAQIGGRYGPW